jgi:hypothetical protein
MKKAKLIIPCLLALCLAPVPPVAAQMAVLDIAALMQAIDQLYATYDQIASAVEQVQNTYQQLEKQISMIKNMDWDNIDLSMSDFHGIPDIRDPINSVTKLVNHNMNLINNVQDTLTKKKITFGGKQYTFGGLFGLGEGSKGTTIFDLPKNVTDFVVDSAEDTIAGYEGKLTYKQKEAIMRRHGLSPRNYATVRLVEEQSQTLIKEMLTVGTGESVEQTLKEAAENQTVIQTLMNGAGESMVAQQQATTSAILNLATGVAKLEAGMNRYTAFAAHQAVEADTLKELEAQQREIEAMKKENERIKRRGIPAGQ